MQTGGVIVAAGMSSRMGSFKPMLPVGGDTLVRGVIRAFIEAGAKPVVLVIGNRGEALRRHVEDLDVVCLYNENYFATQMLDSVKIGLRHLQNLCDQVLVTPGDVPLFSADTLRCLLNTSAPLAAPAHDGVEGHPLLLATSLIPRILGYQGQNGLAGALQNLGVTKALVEVCDPSVLYDVDTPEDYRRLRKRCGEM